MEELRTKLKLPTVAEEDAARRVREARQKQEAEEAKRKASEEQKKKAAMAQERAQREREEAQRRAQAQQKLVEDEFVRKRNEEVYRVRNAEALPNPKPNPIGGSSSEF